MRAFVAVAVAGCMPPPAPYENVNAKSYGPLVVYRGAQGVANPPPCDPDMAPSGTPVDQLSKGITKVLMSPFAGTGVHPSVRNEGLEDQFTFAGDPGMPPVVVLGDDPQHIVFWHMSDIVPVEEVVRAAGKFCGRYGKSARYEGTGRQCGPPQPLPVAINGKRFTRNTYAISSFQCVGAGGVRREAGRR